MLENSMRRTRAHRLHVARGRCFQGEPHMTLLRASVPVVAAFMTLAAIPASASTILWTSWTPLVYDTTAGSASGTIPGGLSVAYTGEIWPNDYLVAWMPTTSFSGGTVGNAPPSVLDGAIKLKGGGTAVDTVTFSSPVVDPVIAIWSLGQGGINAVFA